MSFQTEERLEEAAKRKAANWAAVRRMGRYYFVLLMLPLLLLLWGSGYAAGLLASCAAPARPETISKESNHVR